MEFAIIILIVLAVLFAILLFTWIDVRIVLEQNELNGEVNIFLKYLFIKKKIYPLPKKEKKRKKNQKKI